VTIRPKDEESEEWRALSAKRLVDGYNEAEEEEYSLKLIKESNPEYESGNVSLTPLLKPVLPNALD
jgi:hypothetical protein